MSFQLTPSKLNHLTPPQTPQKMEVTPHQGTKRPHSGGGPVAKISAGEEGDATHDTDGSAPGGAPYTLISTIPQQNIWAPFTVTQRKFKTYRDWTTFLDFEGPARALFISPEIISDIMPPFLKDIVRFTQNSYTLFNLIITNDSITTGTGTVGTATTFNELPFVYLFKDKTGAIGSILSTE